MSEVQLHILKSSKGPEDLRRIGGHGSPEAQTVQEGRLHEFNKFYLIPFLGDKALLAQQEGQQTKINLFSLFHCNSSIVST